MDNFDVPDVLPGGDVMAMSFIVLMEASKSAQDDLKSIMNGIKIINKQKEGWRALQDFLIKVTIANAGKGAGDPVDQGTLNSALKEICGSGAGQANFPCLIQQDFDGNTGHAGFQLNSLGDDGATSVPVSFQSSFTDNKIHIKDITNAQQQIKDALDSDRELGETESMRLQMAMDRLSKLLQTLSNIVKMIGDAQVAIVQNIK